MHTNYIFQHKKIGESKKEQFGATKMQKHGLKIMNTHTESNNSQRSSV